METPRFFADAMLGRLARWLRLLGLDVAYERDIPDARLASRSQFEGRIVLTRDEDFLRRRGVQSLFIKSDRVREQIRQVLETFKLKLHPDQLYSRCSLCNIRLEAISKEEAQALVAEYTYATQARFSRCPACRRVYWRGSHAALLEGFLGSS